MRDSSKVKNLIDSIKALGLDKSKDFYFNECVLVTSGYEYLVTLEYDKLKKDISLHSYYLKDIESLITLLNKELPKEYQIKYLKSDNKQDCK